MNSVENLIKSSLRWVLQVEDQGEDELMIDVAEDNRGKTLGLLRYGIPSVKISPFYITPNYSRDTIIYNINFLLVHYDLCSKSKDKCDENDADIDDDCKYTDYGHFLKDANLFLQDEY